MQLMLGSKRHSSALLRRTEVFAGARDRGGSVISPVSTLFSNGTLTRTLDGVAQIWSALPVLSNMAVNAKSFHMKANTAFHTLTSRLILALRLIYKFAHVTMDTFPNVVLWVHALYHAIWQSGVYGFPFPSQHFCVLVWTVDFTQF